MAILGTVVGKSEKFCIVEAGVVAVAVAILNTLIAEVLIGNYFCSCQKLRGADLLHENEIQNAKGIKTGRKERDAQRTALNNLFDTADQRQTTRRRERKEIKDEKDMNRTK